MTGNTARTYEVSNLTGKVALAAKKYIIVELDCSAIDEFPIEPSDTISVISNLLDNAIEAAEGLPVHDRKTAY